MDETAFVRELRADAPVPDRARLAPGRQRLLDTASSGGRIRRLRSDWRTGAVGAVAAITAATVSATLLVGGGDQGVDASLLSGRGPVGSAKDVLLNAAAMVEDDPVPHPGAKQWVYTRESSYNVTMDENSGIVVEVRPGEKPPPGATVREPVMPGEENTMLLKGPGPHEVEEWIPFGDPAAEKGKKDDDYSAREIYARLADLPDDRDKVLDEVLKFYPTDSEGSETPDQHAFRALGLMFTEQPIVHPEGLAKVYRAMAELPGVKASRVTDTAGRETVAVGMKDAGGAGAEIRMYLLDPATGLPLGQRWTATRDSSAAEHIGPDGKPVVAEPSTAWKKGDVTMEDLVLESALVAKDRQRP
ncbi:CU044_5270 family protein [Streptomyces sp. NPDC057307]|uniref:CU044_5270 family protein n=1 Tax=Streptomyces sp. NPDC057307 TaxID=3346096 RepID=UPI003639E3FC